MLNYKTLVQNCYILRIVYI